MDSDYKHVDNSQKIQDLRNRIESSPFHEVFERQSWYNHMEDLTAEGLKQLETIVNQDEKYVSGLFERIAQKDPEVFKQFLHESHQLQKETNKKLEIAEEDTVEQQMEDLLSSM